MVSMLLCEGSLNISNEISLGDLLDDEPSIRIVSAGFVCRCRAHPKSFISFTLNSFRELRRVSLQCLPIAVGWVVLLALDCHVRTSSCSDVL